MGRAIKTRHASSSTSQHHTKAIECGVGGVGHGHTCARSGLKVADDSRVEELSEHYDRNSGWIRCELLSRDTSGSVRAGDHFCSAEKCLAWR